MAILAVAVFAPALLAGGDQPAAPKREPAEAAQSLFLIGDAGRPAAAGEPVLVALGRDLARDPGRSTVVFLGDDVYPAGLPGPDYPQIEEMRRRLDDQLAVALSSGVRGVMIPGNHDWEKGGAGGWAAVRRLQQRVEERAGAAVTFAPRDGCPGPVVLDVGERLRLVALDTQWWLQRGPKPVRPSADCEGASEAEVEGRLAAALDGRGGREVVVLAHHPLESGGPHGGRFGPKQHLFPLTELRGWAWLPLPIVGSAYPLTRGAGASPQDIPSASYGHMREAFASVLRERRPLAWASGHEHVLQVIESPRFGRVLVSGAGIYGHASYVHDVQGSRYQAPRAGYMRLDLLRDGGKRLAVIEVARDGSAREAWSEPLQ